MPERTIPALSLTQPWATLVAVGAKRIETRSWPTRYRGWLAIHAAQGLAGMTEREFSAYCARPPFAAALSSAFPVPRGAVLAVVRLVDVVGLTPMDVPPEPERSFGDYTPGRYAWHLADVIRLPAPVPQRGALGLWGWPEPPGVAALIPPAVRS